MYQNEKYYETNVPDSNFDAIGRVVTLAEKCIGTTKS